MGNIAGRVENQQYISLVVCIYVKTVKALHSKDMARITQLKSHSGGSSEPDLAYGGVNR